jgi:hypothetical protein
MLCWLGAFRQDRYVHDVIIECNGITQLQFPAPNGIREIEPQVTRPFFC